MLLSHRDLGGAGRPPLVILHGMLGSSRNWQTTGRDFAEKFHVLALDLRNQGESPHAAEMDHPTLVDDVLTWLDAQGLSRVTLLGHSLGGKVAMLLACRHPERVEGLIIVDIAPKGYHSEAHQREFAAMNGLDLVTLTSRVAAEQSFESSISDWAIRKFLLTNLARTTDGHWQWSINLLALTAALPVLEGDSLTPTDKFGGPTLFITGGKSRYVDVSDYAAILAHFPAARIETIAASGHNPHIETREAFGALVLSLYGGSANPVHHSERSESSS
ncbi:MAG: alpha/beta fold hydrolase [Opitutaceae bacterium]